MSYDYFFSETTHVNSYRQAQKLNAKTLTEAKKEASRRQFFYGTVLKIAFKSGLNEEGLLIDPISIKSKNKWYDQE